MSPYYFRKNYRNPKFISKLWWYTYLVDECSLIITWKQVTNMFVVHSLISINTSEKILPEFTDIMPNPRKYIFAVDELFKTQKKRNKRTISVESAISANSFPCFPNHQSNVQHLKGSIHIVVLWQSFGVEQLVMWKLGWGLHLSQSCFNEVRSQPLGAASEHPTLANYPFKVRNVFFRSFNKWNCIFR